MRRIAVAIATAAAVLLPVAIAAVPASAGDATSGTTTITFRITGCDGCTLQGTQIADEYGTPYVGPKVTIRNGSARMVVTTTHTRGMTFWLDAPWRVLIDAQPLIAFEYKGASPGSPITKADVLAAKKASPCWAGTTSSTASLDVSLRTTRVPAFNPEVADPGTTRAPLAWVNPTQKALPPFLPLFDGILAAQDYILCDVG